MRGGKRSEGASLAAGLLAAIFGEELPADGTSSVWRTALGRGTWAGSGDHFLQEKAGLLDASTGGRMQGV